MREKKLSRGESTSDRKEERPFNRRKERERENSER